MTARLILKYPDPLLRTISQDVTEDDWDERVQKWCTDIKDTMKANAGLGLAAPQVGIHKRIFALDVKDVSNLNSFQQEPHDGALIFINPTIKHISKCDAKSVEACLSLPGFMYVVKRSSELEISYTTLDKRHVVSRISGEDAVILQHEHDHLNGKLFIDRLNPFDRKDFAKRNAIPRRQKTEAEINQIREHRRAQARKNRKK